MALAEDRNGTRRFVEDWILT